MKLFVRNTFLYGLIGAVSAIVIYETHEYVATYHQKYHVIILPSYIIILTMLGVLTGRLVLKHQNRAFTDELTGLWNRRYFYKRLPEEIKIMKRNRSALCLALVDIDNFKEINDKYGHIVGDKVLSSTADCIKDCTRSKDFVTRIGGDEFIIVLPDTHLSNGLKIAEKIRRIMESNKQRYGVTISVGIIEVDQKFDVTFILSKVDELLFKAKKEKNLVVSAYIK